MRLHRFFVKESIIENKKIIITDDDLLHQWRHVFRFNTGSYVILFDNSGLEYTVQFVELTYLKAECVVIEKRKNISAPKKEMTLFMSLVKPDLFEWVLEKGTEIGVSHFYPVVTSRTIAKKFNITRAKKIVTEAVEQSGRAQMPTVHEPISFEEIFSTYAGPLFFCDASGASFKEVITDLPAQFAVMIGPEGGWTPEECASVKARKIPIISFGTATLRAETAGIVASAFMLL